MFMNPAHPLSPMNPIGLLNRSSDPDVSGSAMPLFYIMLFFIFIIIAIIVNSFIENDDDEDRYNGFKGKVISEKDRDVIHYSPHSPRG